MPWAYAVGDVLERQESGRTGVSRPGRDVDRRAGHEQASHASANLKKF